MNIFNVVKQFISSLNECHHIPVVSHKFTRTNKDGHIQEFNRYACFKCGKRMKRKT